ncbi:MAG: FxsA family protein [Gordonia sp. (in: high G+C Gram-positive bacteria)]
MHLSYLLIYLVVETAAFVGLASTLGFGWAMLITVLAAFSGFVMLRRQGRKVFAELRRASRTGVDPRTPLADTALIGASSVLLVIPGIVSTIVGMLLLVPGVRGIVRPLVVARGARTVRTSMDRVGASGSTRSATRHFGQTTVIDGSVVVEATDMRGYTAAPGWVSTSHQLPQGPHLSQGR